ncbi:kinase-like protein [Trametes coccinea BRFM310]|uniref:Kinase-like protein n=1 Tax=Trametes coccinea (strain BRFM310) TaxID=1353009 RepID=A0A1Y2INH5_TRAC3|nr:kinase-like protein [Trametes coccinea BRFM310]
MDVPNASTDNVASNPGADPLYPPHIFDPPQAEIDKVVPHLIWPSRTLRVLGQGVDGQGVIYDLGDGRVVKTGAAVSVNEAKAMVFVRAHTSIPVPKVYMVFKHEDLVHIVMERIDGVDFRTAQHRDANGEWSPDGGMLTPQGVRNIVQHLSQIIQELRDLGRRFPLDQPHFGSWPEGPFRNSYFSIDPPSLPFASDAEFHRYFLKRLESKYSDTSTYRDLEELFRTSPAEPAPVLSHGDFADRNILVKDDRVVAIIDWETFGWYPEFWDLMGLWMSQIGATPNEIMGEVFGNVPFAADTYRYVTAAITFPF